MTRFPSTGSSNRWGPGFPRPRTRASRSASSTRGWPSSSNTRQDVALRRPAPGLPYCIYELFHFISPGLYARERKYSVRAIPAGYVMFMLGVALCYFLIFPPHLPLPGDLPGERGRGQPHHPAILHGHAPGDEFPPGRALRASHPVLGAGSSGRTRPHSCGVTENTPSSSSSSSPPSSPRRATCSRLPRRPPHLPAL